MKSFTFLVATILAASALAGCANNATDEPHTNMTPTTSGTPMTPVTPTNETHDEEMPAPDPRCMAPPANMTLPTTNASTRMGMPELAFTTSDASDADPCYRFHGPKTATSGWNAITLTYPAPGMTFHIMPMYFIGNHSMDEVMQAFASGGEPEWATPVGAVGGVTPGQTGSVAIDLNPGNYMYFCPIEGHMFKGMMGMLAVTQAQNESAAPEADATIELKDYEFDLPASIDEDVAVIRVTNNGTEPHEAPLVRLNAGTNMSEFLAAIEDPNATGPPPGALVGGANTISPGQTVYLLVDLEADTSYGMVCFVESESHDGAPHIALGMIAEFEVAHGDGDEH